MDTDILSMTAPISERELATSAFRNRLDKIQGGILKAHGRNKAALLLFRIPSHVRTDVAKQWLGDFAARYVTSSLQQFRQARRREASVGVDGQSAAEDEIFASVLLSAAGYKRLGYDVRGFRDTSFTKSMATAGPELLRDPEPAEWEDRYRQLVDGMILLARDDASALDRVTTAVIRDSTAAGIECFREDGEAPRGEGDTFRDPFGYAHGVSQPLFFGEEIKRLGTTRKWDPSATPDLVLVRDPLVADDGDALGSYLVYRKLETDVPAFEAAVSALARALNPGLAAAPDSEHAAALVAGRYRSGAPLTTGAPRAASQTSNDFNFDADRAGRVCPLHSHIRKANPRGSGPHGLADEREHRIARRGLNYGATGGASGKQGMLFMCYQAKIQRQFEFIQRRWLNDANFPADQTGRDPLGAGDPTAPAQRWPASGRSGGSQAFQLGGYVSLRGGEYFFAPSITFLDRLRSR